MPMGVDCMGGPFITRRSLRFTFIFTVHPLHGLAQQVFQRHQFLGLQRDASPHGLWHRFRLFLHRPALVRQVQKQLSLVAFRGNPVNQAQVFKPFEQRGQGAGFQVQKPSQLALRHPAVFPQGHHHQILRVGDSQGFQRLSVLSHHFLGAGIQGKTQLVFQQQRVALCFQVLQISFSCSPA